MHQQTMSHVEVEKLDYEYEECECDKHFYVLKDKNKKVRRHTGQIITVILEGGGRIKINNLDFFGKERKKITRRFCRSLPPS